MSSIILVKVHFKIIMETVQPHFHNSGRFQGDSSAKSEDFFSRHSRHSQKRGDIVTLKTPANRDILYKTPEKNLHMSMLLFSQWRDQGICHDVSILHAYSLFIGFSRGD